MHMEYVKIGKLILLVRKKIEEHNVRREKGQQSIKIKERCKERLKEERVRIRGRKTVDGVRERVKKQIRMRDVTTQATQTERKKRKSQLVQ